MKVTSVFDRNAMAYYDNYRYIINRGGTRSSKTYSILQLLYLISVKSKKQRIISIVSHSVPHLMGGAIRDFDDIIQREGISLSGIKTKNPHIYRINNCIIEFIGFDKPGKALGAARNILFINEANKMPHDICHQLIMRTTETIFVDYNPSDVFWIDDEGYLERGNAIVVDSTFRDNVQNISEAQIDELLNSKKKYDNEIAKGIKGYWFNWWRVYGLGLQGMLEGVIFQNWKEFDKLPDRNFYRMFVVDWGGTHPTSLSQLDIDSGKMELYITQHVYIPQILNRKFIEKIQEINPQNHEVICDAARSDKIWELINAGINAFGSSNQDKLIISGIELLQEYSIFVKGEDAKREFGTYKWAADKITGKSTGKPEDANNHIIDAVRYGIRFYHRVVKSI